MRPHTPTINTSRAGLDVTSPPETPTTGSPKFNRKAGAGPDDRPSARGGPRRPSIPPLGGVGSQFAYVQGIRPEELSPQSSDSSDDDSETSASPPQSPVSNVSEPRISVSHIPSTQVIVEATFEIEECSEDDEDAMDSDDDEDRADVLQPYDYEDAESERSASRTQSEVDPQLVNSMGDVTFDSDDSDLDSEDGSEFMKNLKLQRQNRRIRRMTSGSISKRTVSERGSDSDREDLQPWDNGESVQRRIRRKVNRHSLLSIPPEIIIELKEPNSDGEVVWDEHEIDLARELPFWTMEVDSD
ncbi:hypothetical protein JX265_001957 [Neoarthrinium moseri]|uniref:Uncharacterized protein n=1 Tax=Neoarthrinium moseri TaxID=1658444 RepID=A0A9Q0AVL9_9PEZI|nr:uncharacterized protein JN550_005703 [Neoarthrinium moseri]KAI1847949.1 hypothetical protein JX266_006062 [Neoarthrinium moseri]KAI1869722.1 hypothetical protein JN550_005703 [Neoarthrinium moseri]KAI1880336.1 hypothetical protein JX265_001957 [Neoarthrinium moseri]